MFSRFECVFIQALLKFLLDVGAAMQLRLRECFVLRPCRVIRWNRRKRPEAQPYSVLWPVCSPEDEGGRSHACRCVVFVKVSRCQIGTQSSATTKSIIATRSPQQGQQRL